MRYATAKWPLFFVALAAGTIAAAAAHAGPPVAIQLRETAGIRRFQYPVAVELRLPTGISRESRFRLVRADKPVQVQVRPAEDGGSVARWWIDFATDLLPHESADYALECGPDVQETPGRKQGHRLMQDDDQFRVVNEPYIAWTLPRDLEGLLRSVRSGELEYLGKPAAGLMLRDATGKAHPIGGKTASPRASVLREGTLAVGLRFAHAETDPALAEVRWTVDLLFPVFKSWVEVDWRIEDPQARVAGAGAEIQVNVDPPTPQRPTLVDIGTAGLVYMALGPAQQAELRGIGTEWQVLRGRADRLEPFVAGPQSTERHARPEGWIHVMDRQRCLAMAVDRFAEESEDRINISSDGRVDLSRTFREPKAAAASAPKRLRFWMHFVPFPPQQTAATSPQAMQNPIVTEVRVGGR